MTEGFRAIPSLDSVLIPGVSSQFSAPVNIATPDVSVFQSLELSFVYSGAASGNPQEFEQVQLLWRDTLGNICWVDTVEFPSANVAGFSTSNPAYVLTPIRGATLQLVSTNTGPGTPGTPLLTVNVYGSYRPVPRLICWQDALNFRCTDLILIGQVVAAALVAPASATIVTSGLGSGPCAIVMNSNLSGGGGSVRYRFTFGTTGLGWPDVIQTNGGGAAATISNAVTGLFLPRRAIGVLVTALVGTVNNYNFNIVRDEP